MTALIIAIFITLTVSAFCSLLEAFILSTTVTEVEQMKRLHPKRGEQLESFRTGIGETSSAILTLNTIANTAGSIVVGTIAASVFGQEPWVKVSIASVVTVSVLIFSEIIPKNLGVLYRKSMGRFLVLPLFWVRLCMKPFTFLAKRIVHLVARGHVEEIEDAQKDAEIILLTEKHAMDGSMLELERDIIHNTLKLDKVQVQEVMTPRTVVEALEESQTVTEALCDPNKTRFARLPVYNSTIDKVTGTVRRRDMLTASAEGKGNQTIQEIKRDHIIIVSNASAADALLQLVESHQELGIVVNEFGSMVGVVALEDIVEQLLGREIYEADDLHVDMRKFALGRMATHVTTKNAKPGEVKASVERGRANGRKKAAPEVSQTR